MSEPLVLVVEDDKDALDLRVRQLQSAGCRAVAVSSSNEAIREIWHTPLLGGVLTDINLVRTEDDKSGVALARYIKTYRPEMPVTGYSGVFAEGRLSEAEVDLFDAYYPAGQLRASQIRVAMVEVAELAKEFEALRRTEANRELERVRVSRQLSEEVFESFRQLVPDQDFAIEQALVGANLEAHIVAAGRNVSSDSGGGDSSWPRLRLRIPVIIWIRRGEDGVEAEVHGTPELYSFGINQEESIDNVLRLAMMYYFDLHDAVDLAGPIQRLATFLDGIFVEVPKAT